MSWGEVFTFSFLASVLAAGVNGGTPLLFSALGELVSEKSGVLNLGVEGMMLVGALSGFTVANISGSPWLGLLAGVLCGGLYSLIHAFLTVTLKSNQVISGVMLVLLGVGLTTFLGKGMVGASIEGIAFSKIGIPILHEIPFFGEVLFNHTILAYIAAALVPIVYVVLYKTSWGLELISVGEDPRTADTLGINVERKKYICVFIGGMLAGAGGASLTLAFTKIWLGHVTAGRGWIAIAIVIFSMWKPQRVILGAYLFGAVEGLQFRLQSVGIDIPYNLLGMMPYAVTLIVLVIASREKIKKRIGAPSNLGEPYLREG